MTCLRASNDLARAGFLGDMASGVPPVRFWLACDRRKVLIEVWDASTELPVPQDVRPDAEDGRGLRLVRR